MGDRASDLAVQLSTPPGGEAPTASLTGGGVAPEVCRDDRIGPYRVVRRLGSGGMGVVYLAEQEAPIRRSVALKVIRSGLPSDTVLARFDRERQTLALMDHPAIARVFDAGATERGQPYFVMELVEGEPITRYCDRERLTVDERLALFQQVCQGIQHAHQKGVIHRDIKPSNVLVRDQDGRRAPKIIDFGVAKAIAEPQNPDATFTATGELVGTPVYMSPEQLAMHNEDIDTRTDVYSLGVMLYELLVGVRPWEMDDLRRRFLEEDPTPLGQRLGQIGNRASCVAQARRTDVPALGRKLRGDLDWITRKALERDRSRRYGSPTELESDLTRHLQHEPVLVGPPSTGYRMRKFARRHRAGVVAGSLVVLALVAGIVGTTAGMLQAIEARGAEARQARIARAVNDFLNTDVLGGVDPLVARDPGVTLREVLDAAAGRIGSAFPDDPQVRAALQLTMGLSYFDLGELEKSEGQLTAALETLRRTVGEDAVETVRALAVLGAVLGKQGRLTEAEPMLRAGLDGQRRVLGPEHADTLRSACLYAYLLEHQGKLEEALDEFERVARDAARALGTSHALTLWTQVGLAEAHVALGRFAQADELSKRVLETAHAAFEEDHPATLAAMDGRSVVLDSIGALAEAEQLRRDALRLRSARFGPNHVETLDAMSRMAWSMFRNGKLDEAEVAARTAWAGLQERLGEAHLATIEAMSTLAIILERTSRSEQALELRRQAYELRRTALGEAHPFTLQSMNNFGVALWYRRDLEGAEQILEQASAIWTNAFGADHPETLRVVHNLGLVRMDQGRLDEAARDFEAVLDARRRTLGEDAASLADPLKNLAMVRGRQERPAEAAELAWKALELQRRKFGPAHWAVLDTVLHVATHQRSAGEPDEAAALLEEGLETIRGTADPSLSNLKARMQATLGGCLTDLARYEEAEALLLEAHATFRRAGWTFGWISELLVELYQAWGKPERAAEYRSG